MVKDVALFREYLCNADFTFCPTLKYEAPAFSAPTKFSRIAGCIDCCQQQHFQHSQCESHFDIVNFQNIQTVSLCTFPQLLTLTDGRKVAGKWKICAIVEFPDAFLKIFEFRPRIKIWGRNQACSARICSGLKLDATAKSGRLFKSPFSRNQWKLLLETSGNQNSPRNQWKPKAVESGNRN